MTETELGKKMVIREDPNDRGISRLLCCFCCCRKKKAAVIPKADEKIQEVMDKLHMDEKDLGVLWSKFEEYDYELISEFFGKSTITSPPSCIRPSFLHYYSNSRTINVTEFYEMINEQQSIFTESIFELVDVDDSGELSFTEFVQMIGTYCVFGIEEVLKCNATSSDEDELMALVDIIHNSEVTSNLKKALKDADKNGDGKIDFDEFTYLNKIFPNLLYPAFRIQNRMQENTLGEKWWKNKRADLEELRQKKKGEADLIIKKENARIMRRRKTKVYKKMGCCWYYLCCSKRSRLYAKLANEAYEESEREKRRLEKKRRARIAAAERREAEMRVKERKEEKKKEPPKPPTRSERRERAADRREKRKRR